MSTPRLLRIALVCAASVLWAQATASPQQSPGVRPTHGAALVASKRHDGTTARDAIPGSLHHRNTHGNDPWKSGNCVFASIAHTAKHQGIAGLDDFHLWMQNHEGGGWPEKVDRKIVEKLGRDHGLDYVHVYGPDALPVLEKAIADGYMPCVSLGYSERYRELGYAIDHMVNLVHLDDRWACILDNNFPGDDRYEWMPRDEFAVRFQWGREGKGEGWAIVFFSGSPQPPEPEPAP